MPLATISRNGNFIKDVELTEMVRIPHPIDSERPERGLVGMITELIDITPRGGVWFVRCIKRVSEMQSETVCEFAETPYLALLKALTAQWGIEV